MKKWAHVAYGLKPDGSIGVQTKAERLAVLNHFWKQVEAELERERKKIRRRFMLKKDLVCVRKTRRRQIAGA